MFMVAQYAPAHILVDRTLGVLQGSSAGNLQLDLTAGESLDRPAAGMDRGLRSTLRLIAEAAMRVGKTVLLDDIALGRGMARG